MTAPCAIKRADMAQRRQVGGPLGGGGVRSSPPPPRDVAQGDQWKTVVNSNNYGSGRALDDENVDDNNNGRGSGPFVPSIFFILARRSFFVWFWNRQTPNK